MDKGGGGLENETIFMDVICVLCLNLLSRDLSLSNLTKGWLMIKSHMSNHKATYSFDHIVT